VTAPDDEDDGKFYAYGLPETLPDADVTIELFPGQPETIKAKGVRVWPLLELPPDPFTEPKE
jgi:hypothetical protein